MALLTTKNLTMQFGGITAVDNVDFMLEKGEIVGIIGPNGAGKSTMFNCITGVYTPTGGKVVFNGNDITNKGIHEIAKLGMTRTFQNIRLFPDMTVIENVLVGEHTKINVNFFETVFKPANYRRLEKNAYTSALNALNITQLEKYKYHDATSLPYGLQRRLEIARAIVSKPHLLLFDEPAAGMNENETLELAVLIKNLQMLGASILLIEHDMKLVMSVCDRVYVLNQGILIAEGSPSTIKSNPRVIEAYLGKAW